MRPQTQRRIDALHAEIERLIDMEKRYHVGKFPNENSLWRYVNETRLAMYRHCPNDRAQMVEAVAVFPAVGRPAA